MEASLLDFAATTKRQDYTSHWRKPTHQLQQKKIPLADVWELRTYSGSAGGSRRQALTYPLLRENFSLILKAMLSSILRARSGKTAV